jgi:hypothetical protein
MIIALTTKIFVMMGYFFRPTGFAKIKRRSFVWIQSSTNATQAMKIIPTITVMILNPFGLKRPSIWRYSWLGYGFSLAIEDGLKIFGHRSWKNATRTMIKAIIFRIFLFRFVMHHPVLYLRHKIGEWINPFMHA